MRFMVRNLTAGFGNSARIIPLWHWSANRGRLISLTDSLGGPTTGEVTYTLGTSASFEYVNSIVALSNNIWYTVAVSYDGDVLRVYIDGDEKNTKTIGALTVNDDAELIFGNTVNRDYNGQIAFAGFWDRALAGNEIRTLHEDLTGFLRKRHTAPPRYVFKIYTIGTGTHVAQTGTIDTLSAGATTVTGTSTAFQTDYDDGDIVVIDHGANGEVAYTVNGEPASQTSMTIDNGLAFATTAGASHYADGTARDYSTITAWEAALQPGSQRGECYNDSTFHEAVTINDTDPDNVTLTAASGEEHDGTSGSGVRIVPPAGSTGLNIARDDVTVSWLEVDGVGRGINTLINVAFSSNFRTVSHCLVHGSAPGGVANGINGRSMYAIRNIVYDLDGGSGVGIGYTGNTSGAVEAYNNTVHEIDNGAGGLCFDIADQANKKLRNNIATNPNAGDCYGLESPSSATIDYNLASDTTASGTGSLDSKTAANQYESIVVGSENLHIVASADAADVGVKLSTTPTGVNIDIDGFDLDADISRDPWDMGAHEVEPAAAPTVITTPYYYTHLLGV
jgi:hypothetical protein